MARYFYVWIPAVALSVVLLFIVPFLGLIVAAVFAVGAVALLAALALRIVAALDTLVRFALRRRPGQTDAAQQQGSAPAIPGYRQPAQSEFTAQAQAAMALEHQRT
jgi:membrane protein implicated in regulation of membrane protease activity